MEDRHEDDPVMFIGRLNAYVEHEIMLMEDYRQRACKGDRERDDCMKTLGYLDAMKKILTILSGEKELDSGDVARIPGRFVQFMDTPTPPHMPLTASEIEEKEKQLWKRFDEKLGESMRDAVKLATEKAQKIVNERTLPKEQLDKMWTAFNRPCFVAETDHILDAASLMKVKPGQIKKVTRNIKDDMADWIEQEIKKIHGSFQYNHGGACTQEYHYEKQGQITALNSVLKKVTGDGFSPFASMTETEKDVRNKEAKLYVDLIMHNLEPLLRALKGMNFHPLNLKYICKLEGMVYEWRNSKAMAGRWSWYGEKE